MNYYIQGNKDRAEEIKAAFEAKGFKLRSPLSKCDQSDMIYFSIDGEVRVINARNLKLFKNRPDYKELELPAKAKFKVGDWIACDADSFTLSIKSVKDGNYYFHQGASLPIKDIDEHYHLWTIQDAKDGDVLVTTTIRNCPFIYRKTSYKNNLAYYYVGIDGNGDLSNAYPKNTLCHFGPASDVAPATKEQRDLLFAKIKDAGCEWDVEKKELCKIKSHHNIENFKPFDKVLTRNGNDSKWECRWFSRYDNGQYLHFRTTQSAYRQCIPFEGNEHLLGTTDPCSEEFVNW